MKLTYDAPAQAWEEALPIGNGRLGAMVFGGAEQERLQLNEDTLYSGEPLPLGVPDIKGSLDHVRGLLNQEKWGEAHAYVTTHWLGRCQQSYQPVGNLLVDIDGAGRVEDYSRELDLASAVVHTHYRRNGKTHTRDVFASYPGRVVLVRLACDKPGELSFGVRLTSPHPTSQATSQPADVVLRGQAPGFALRRDLETVEGKSEVERKKYPELWDDAGTRRAKADQLLYGEDADGKGMRFEARVRVAATDGTVTVDDDRVRVDGATSALLLVSVATSFNGVRNSPSTEGRDESVLAEGYLERLEGRSYEDLLREHVEDYRTLYNRVSIRLGGESDWGGTTPARVSAYAENPDPGLVALLFQYGRYLMIAGSRPESQPLNLQGIWNEHVIPPWCGAYTININTEMNYWPSEVANLSECGEPLFRMTEECAESGRETARSCYGLDGWVAHHNVTIWRNTDPVDGDARAAFWPVAGGWLSRHLWEHYLFTCDTQFLEKRAWPAMRGAAEFLLGWLVEDEDGRLVTPVSTSPENGFGAGNHAVSIGCTMDLAICRDLFTSAVEASEILGRDEALRARLSDALGRLLPYKVGQHGQLQEWSQDWDDPEDEHRHVSHLYGLHPAASITPDTPEFFQAAKQSLLHRGDGGTGWSMAWKVNFWARFLDGDHALEMIGNMLHLVSTDTNYRRGGLYPNLFDAHPPFQIDGNFGVTAGIAEMLLQSHRGFLHLLPALPTTWPVGEVRGLRGRGDITVSMAWAGGILTRAEILAGRDAELRLKFGTGQGCIHVKTRTEDVTTCARDGLVCWDARKGSVYTVHID